MRIWQNKIGRIECKCSIFQNLYDKHCPIKDYKRKLTENGKPWMTKNLINRCKKKNALHRESITRQTMEVEAKYRKYINKLVKILRTTKKSIIVNHWKDIEQILEHYGQN